MLTAVERVIGQQRVIGAQRPEVVVFPQRLGGRLHRIEQHRNPVGHRDRVAVGVEERRGHVAHLAYDR